jgi:GNAT superfamily N-acetyltransferase
MLDTHPQIQREMEKRISALSGLEKVVMACSMFDFAKELATAQILEANPYLSQQDIRREVFVRFYERDFSSEQLAAILEGLDRAIFYPAEPAETDELNQLAFRSKAHWPYPSKYLEDCKETIRMTKEYVQNSHVMVLKQKVKVGFYSFCMEAGKPLLDNLWVDPPFIGKGFGKKLFDAAVTYAKNSGWEEFKIISDPEALGFYLKMGAERVGEIESKYMKGLMLPVLRMRTGESPRYFTTPIARP